MIKSSVADGAAVARVTAGAAAELEFDEDDDDDDDVVALDILGFATQSSSKQNLVIRLIQSRKYTFENHAQQRV